MYTRGPHDGADVWVTRQPQSIHMRCLWSSGKHEELGWTGWVPRVLRTEVALGGFGPSAKSDVRLAQQAGWGRNRGPEVFPDQACCIVVVW